MRITRGSLIYFGLMMAGIIMTAFTSLNINRVVVTAAVTIFSGILSEFVVNEQSYKNNLFFLLAFSLPMQIFLWVPHPSNLAVETADSFSISYLDIIILLLLLYSIYNRNYEKINKNSFPISLKIVSALLLIVYVLSTVVSINVVASLYSLARLIKAILLAYLVIKLYTPVVYSYFIEGLKYTMLAQLAVGTLQFIKGDIVGLGLGYLGEKMLRDSEGAQAGISGTLNHPGDFALFFIFVLICLLFYKKSRVNFYFILITVVGILLAQSRTAIAIMAVVFILKFLFSKQKTISTMNFIVALIIAIVGLPFIIGILDIISDRFFNSDLNWQIKNRMYHFELAKEIFSYRSHFAFGPNASLTASQLFFPTKFYNEVFYYVNPIHNAYLVYMLETGVIGLVAYILLLLINLKNAIMVLFKKDSLNRNIILGAAIWILAFSAYSLTGFAGIKDRFFFMIWIVIGISVANINILKDKKHSIIEKE